MTGSTLADLLVAGGAPPELAATAEAELGADGADPVAVLRADPWRLLDLRRVRPEQADAWAARVARAGAQDPRRAAALVSWTLRRAAADGHTALPAAAVARALVGLGVADPSAGVRAASEAGRCVAVPGEAGALLALPDLAEAEERLAEGLERLTVTAVPVAGPAAGPAAGAEAYAAVLAHGVVGVETPAGSDLRAAVAAWTEPLAAAGLRIARADAEGLAARTGVLAAAGVAVVEGAERLDVPAAARLVDALPDGCRLVLAGDPALLPPAGPGQVLANLQECGTVPWVGLPASAEGPRATIGRLVGEVRAGHLPDVADPDRSVVIAPTSDDHAAGLVGRLVTASIPATFGIPAERVTVLTPRRGGAVGARVLQAALAAAPDAGEPRPQVTTVHEGRARRADAAVVVLPAEAAGSLSRALVATAFGLAERHLSVVAAAGPALREAVARVPGRPRTTRLAGLLAEP